MGHLIIVSGFPATGTGKTTVVKKILPLLGDAARIITCTTRPKRAHEYEGVDYHFLSEDAFQGGLRAGDFLEHDQHYMHWYGTRKSDVLKTLHDHTYAVLTTDLAGAATWMELYPEACFVAITAKVEDVSNFMCGRGDSHEKIAERLTKTQLKKERRAFIRMRFNVVVANESGQLEETAAKFVRGIQLYDFPTYVDQDDYSDT
jgi:guanylate kinase